MGPKAEDALLEKIVTPKPEVDVPSASLEILTPVAMAVDPFVLVCASSMESTQPSCLLAITQGNCRPRQSFSYLYIILQI